MSCRTLVVALLGASALAACGLVAACSHAANDVAAALANGADAEASGSGGMPAADAGGAGAGPGAPDGMSDAAAATGAGPRDWAARPAIVDVAAPATIYAVTDVHGGYDRLVALLLANHLLVRAPMNAKDAHWAGGPAALVVTGDLIDKGPSGIEVIDFLMALETDARAKGALVVVTLGNHEAELLVDPTNAKAASADGIDAELSAAGISPATFVSAADPRGAWLRLLPFGARLGGWFFAHAGDARGRSVGALEAALEAAVKAHADYNDPELVGPTSILESRDWFTSATVSQDIAALGVKHIVMGHDPKALGPRGAIATAFGDALVRIDCGMSPGVNDSAGKLLRITQQGASDVVDELDPSGASRALFQSPR